MKLFAFALLCLSPQPIDGDTLRCSNVGLIRIADIASCETRGREPVPTCTREQARKSRQALASIVRGRRVTYTPVKPCNPRERRIVALVYADGAPVGRLMIARGDAVRFVCRRKG